MCIDAVFSPTSVNTIFISKGGLLMSKHPWLIFFTVLIAVGLIVGISVGDLWQYIIDFTKMGIDLFVNWINEVITALRDSISDVTPGNNAKNGFCILNFRM